MKPLKMEQSSIVKIIIVDDNKDGAFMLRLLMKTLISADIRIAFDGTSGIENGVSPDLNLLCD